MAADAPPAYPDQPVHVLEREGGTTVWVSETPGHPHDPGGTGNILDHELRRPGDRAWILLIARRHIPCPHGARNRSRSARDSLV